MHSEEMGRGVRWLTRCRPRRGSRGPLSPHGAQDGWQGPPAPYAPSGGYAGRVGFLAGEIGCTDLGLSIDPSSASLYIPTPFTRQGARLSLPPNAGTSGATQRGLARGILQGAQR